MFIKLRNVFWQPQSILFIIPNRGGPMDSLRDCFHWTRQNRRGEISRPVACIAGVPARISSLCLLLSQAGGGGKMDWNRTGESVIYKRTCFLFTGSNAIDKSRGHFGCNIDEPTYVYLLHIPRWLHCWSKANSDDDDDVVVAAAAAAREVTARRS